MSAETIAQQITKRVNTIAQTRDSTSAFVGVVVQVSPLRVDVTGVSSSCMKLSDVPALAINDSVLVVRAIGLAGALVCVGKVVAS